MSYVPCTIGEHHYLRGGVGGGVGGVPVLVAPTLGELTRSGFTIDYYASPGELSWKSTQLKVLHDTLVNADFFAQGILNTIPTSLVRVIPGVDSRLADGIDKLKKIPLPGAAPFALILEVAAGGRSMNSATRGALLLQANYAAAGAGLAEIGVVVFGGLAALALAGALETLGVTAALAAPLGVLASLMQVLAAVDTAAAAVLFSLANGTPPDKRALGTGMKAVGTAMGKPVSDEAVDLAYAGASAASANAPWAPNKTSTSKTSSTPSGDASRASATSTTPRKTRHPGSGGASTQSSSSGGSAPIILGGAAVAAFLILRRRR